MNTNLDCYFDETNDEYRDYLVRKKIHGRMAKRVNKIEDTLRDRKDMMSSLDFNDLNSSILCTPEYRLGGAEI